MAYYEKQGNLTVIRGFSKFELSLDKTFDCGQTFLWDKKEGIWYGALNNRLVMLKQYDIDRQESAILTNVEVSEIESIINFLNLDMDYTSEVKKLNLTNFAYIAYENGKGIHILRQDLFETMVQFLMSQCNSMGNIKNIVNKLRAKYGTPLSGEMGGTKVETYTFPSLDTLASIDSKELYNSFIECSMGFRASYLAQMIKTLKTHPEMLKNIANSDYDNAMKQLKSFNGIGNKVANCICLFSKHCLDSFPIDRHIERIIDNEFGGYLDIKSLGNIAGVIQQYLYYYYAFD